jgi:hypothetical protein
LTEPPTHSPTGACYPDASTIFIGVGRTGNRFWLNLLRTGCGWEPFLEMKMKVFVDADEWYPVYTLHTEQCSEEELEIDSIFYERYKKAYDEFRAVQSELRVLVGDD